jgi:hypothetical protein
VGELRVEVPAEFTGPTGAGVEATDDGWVDVFHEELAPGGGRKRIRPVCEAESQHSAAAEFNTCVDAAFVLQGTSPDKPLAAPAIFAPWNSSTMKKQGYSR